MLGRKVITALLKEFRELYGMAALLRRIADLETRLKLNEPANRRTTRVPASPSPRA